VKCIPSLPSAFVIPYSTFCGSLLSIFTNLEELPA
jgi:hypothetical protein